MISARINVLAGVNGSGKSSVLGEFIRSSGGDFFNPDSFTREIRERHSDWSLKRAQIFAWEASKDQLLTAIEEGKRYSFETTLGGKTITQTLIDGAEKGARISVFYVGLESVELNIQRVKERVAQNGHDIPIGKIRERFKNSPLNLVRLMPYLNSLVLYDNSHPVEVGAPPKPSVLLRIKERKLISSDDLIRPDFPEWAQPLAMRAIDLFPSG